MNARSEIVSPHVLYRVAWGIAAVSGGLMVVVAYLSQIPWVARSLPAIGIILALIGVGCAGALLRRSGSLGNAPWTHHLALGVNVIVFFGFFVRMIGV